ncbi:MAG: hypothetical protein LZF86_190523 [Nitrospira sp.]|nr:MAG: hypothetical protein LZF86_190523 [Nitrospira sp.]
MTRHHRPTAPRWQPARLWKYGLLAIALSGGALTSACTTIELSSRSIYDDSETRVGLESRNRAGFSHEAAPPHPISLTQEQIEILLTSISARNKIGLLRSFAGDPGTPRLFDQTDIRILSGPLQHALARATAGEVVVFYRAKPATDAYQRVTSGTIVAQGETLLLSIANFWHPLVTAASEVGGTDQLHDIRETTGYVWDHPWVSVGEQDFAVFFDDPHYQTTPRHSSLLDYPERTLSIAYQAYLTANPDPVKRVQEVHDAMQQATLGKAESAAIAELKKRIADLERANAELAATAPKMSVPATLPPSPAQDQTQELMMQLEKRVAELERALKESESYRKQASPPVQ